MEIGEKEFRKMVDAIDEMNHDNMLPLTAYYHSFDETILVYDYMLMGNLYALLHVNGSGGRSPLIWNTRICIALGTARAIAYIHSHSPTTIHGNIKSSNVLLSTTFEARVSDYGLIEYTTSAELAPFANRDNGYCAPEVTTCTSKASQKADVYSFGVLFLELLTGKDPTKSYLKKEGMNFRIWMLLAVNGEWTSEVFDVEILRHENPEVLLQYLKLAFVCTARDPVIRPSMAQLISQIEELGCSSSYVF